MIDVSQNLSRRQALRRLAAALPLAAGATWPMMTLATASDPMSHYLGATDYIDRDNPVIAATASRIGATARSDRERALAAFTFVRDEIRFGFASRFYDMKASEVLSAGIGFCNTKSTLFVALLRAMGLPARQVFVDIDAGILAGILDPGTPFVDHSYTEVRLGGRWIALDAYIVDPPLMRAAKARLAAEGRTIGYGVHRDGTDQWDGTTPAFAQFVTAGGAPVATRRRFGPHDDVGTFYETAETWNRLSLPTRFLAGFAFAAANRKLDAMRRGEA